MIELLVAADDRTGALEAAGACADAGWGMVEVLTLGSSGGGVDGSAVVMDLGTRHLAPGLAARRASSCEPVAARWTAHKIDSTLRGNWADELVARQRAGGRAVLVVPAFPALGRTCVGGVVLDDGRPVSEGPAGRDARTPVRSSRAADHLRAAGTADVVELGGAPAVEAWLASAQPVFAVCDATSDADLSELGRVSSQRSDLLYAGTSASIGAAAAAMAPPAAAIPSPALAAPVLVVCGSLHPSARAQASVLVAAGAARGLPGPSVDWALEALDSGRPAVLVSPEADRDLLSEAQALAMTHAMASTVGVIRRGVDIGTLVVIGGDVAAEALGPDPMVVGGTVQRGVPWCRWVGAERPLVLTRAGGFGRPNALVELLSGVLVP